jgi:hypothetical protein
LGEGFDKRDYQPALLRWPKIIVRTVAGIKSYGIYTEENIRDVFIVKRHTPYDLEWITNADTMILWEPDTEKTPVIFSSIDARIVTTLLPDSSQYHEFMKNPSTTFYLPCPSELQIHLMGLVYQSILNNFISDEEIKQKVRDFGPFMRTVLLDSDPKREYFTIKRAGNIDSLVMKGFQDIRAVVLIEDEDKFGLSHRLAKFVVDYMEPNVTRRYNKLAFAASSEKAESEIVKTIRKATIDVIIDHLVKANDALIDFQGFNSKALERLFVTYASSESGLTWEYQEMPLKTIGGVYSGRDWEKKFFKLESCRTVPVPFSDMPINVLYYPDNAQFFIS